MAPILLDPKLLITAVLVALTIAVVTYLMRRRSERRPELLDALQAMTRIDEQASNKILPAQDEAEADIHTRYPDSKPS